MRCIGFKFSAGYCFSRRPAHIEPLGVLKQIWRAKCYKNETKLVETMSVSKPPNVLIYSGENTENVFKNAAENLLKVLHPDKYVVYELTKSQVLVQPWKENIALLVVLSDCLEESTLETFRNYLANDGKMLVFCSNFTMPEMGLCCTSSKEGFVSVRFADKLDVDLYHGKFSYNFANAEIVVADASHLPVVMKATCNRGILVMSEVHLVLDSDILVKDAPNNKKGRLEILESILTEVLGLEVCSISIPEPTPGFVLTKDDSRKPEFTKLKGEIPIEKGTSPRKVPLYFKSEITPSFQFDKQSYFSNLRTLKFGHVTIYFPIVTSTMIPAEHVSDIDGAVLIAGRQIQGVGRGGNQWISPEGCAMFTLNLTLFLSSTLGNRLSLLQHMATLAVILGIKKIPGYERLNLRLKWPNDLYHENDKKIGGVLVNSTIQGNLVHAYIGIGVNVANQRPTLCINSIIKEYNETTGNSLPLLTTEVVIACTLSELEHLVDSIMTSGPDEFLLSYYKYWLHANQRITLSSLGKEATIEGLDDYGFLVVKTDDGNTLKLQPDGNRFDMMQNLIVSN